MISNDRAKYGSPTEWLSALRQDELWTFQEEQLLEADSCKTDALRTDALEAISANKTVSFFWGCYNHNVEKTIQEAWDTGMSMPNLKIIAINLLTLEWLEQQEASAIIDTRTGEPQEELNFFAPKKNLQVLLKQAWFAEVRTDAKYDATWTDGFVEALMASEYGKGIARQWAIQGARNKRNQLRAYVVGLLTDAGVLKGSYVEIANKTGLNNKERTFSTHMSRGKKQPYADWVKEYVKGDENVSEKE